MLYRKVNPAYEISCGAFSKQVKPGFTNYQPQPKYSWALSKTEMKMKLGKTKDFLKTK